MSHRSLSLRTAIGPVILAILLAGCPTSDPEVVDGNDAGVGVLEDGATTTPGLDGGGPGPGVDGATADADAAPPPPPCGRLTTVCKDGEKCAGAPDCASKVCFNGLCKARVPADGAKNGDETDIDCGGSSAPACADGKDCVAKADCTSGVCTTLKCQVPTATDTVQNGDETGVDCGGTTTSAPKCGAGLGCLSNADCDNLKCDLVQKKCLAAGHDDGLKNDGETGIDCGGTAPTKCGVGGGCVSNGDCNALACDVGATNACLPASHTDLIKNLGETGIDCGGAAVTRCPTGEGCLVTADCDAVACDAAGTKLCLAPTHTDGIKNFGETGIDCGGTALPTKCATGQGCGTSADCDNVLCTAGLVCDSPTRTDGLTNGTETDKDCGGAGFPTCKVGETCKAAAVGALPQDGNCVSGACNYAGKCVEHPSCKPQNGGNTCGPNGNDSCCVSLPVSAAAGASILDKYNITAGRMRAFVKDAAVDGNVRKYITDHKPAWWNDNWTAFLPVVLDTPNGSNADYNGVYQELGPNLHGAGAGGNGGCNIGGNGARTFRLPDAVNARMSDPQMYDEAVLDQRTLNCVPVYMIAAFCAWDGGKLPTRTQWNMAWGGGTYPWGNAVVVADPPSIGKPLGYRYAQPKDPKGVGVPQGSYSEFQAAPWIDSPLSQTDLKWANYNYNFWGAGANTMIGSDYSIYVAPPGRFPNGNSASGHADLAGNVFNALDLNAAGTTAGWSKSGSWQGHAIPYSQSNFNAGSKYWAMGGRCAR